MFSVSSTTNTKPTLKEIVSMKDKKYINPAENHQQALSVMNDLKINNKTGYESFQRVIKERIDNNVGNKLSFTVNAKEVDISKILCVAPMGGIKVVMFLNVSDGSWFKCFTGNEWRISTKRLFGIESSKYIETEEIIVDCLFNEENNKWEITNITNKPPTNVSFGPNKRAVSFDHLVGHFANPSFMEGTLNIDEVSGCNFTTDDENDATATLNVGKYACEFVKNNIFPVEEAKLSNIKEPECYSEEKVDELEKRNILYSELTANVPEVKDSIKILDDKHVVVIIGADDEEEEWALDNKIWEKLFKSFAKICKHTIPN